MGTGEGLNPEQMDEEQLRAAYEAEIKRIRVEHVLLENVVTVINLGMRRTGLMPGTEDEYDPEQIALAVDSVRALLPIVERIAPEQLAPIEDALAQLQIAFVKASGRGTSTQAPAADAAPDGDQEPPTPGEPGPAQRSGRLWVPGQ